MKDIASGRDTLTDHAERWRDWLDNCSDVEDLALDEDEALDPADLAAYGLAALQRATDVALAEVDRKTLKTGTALNGRVSVLQQRVRELETDREQHAAAGNALRERVASLETSLKQANAGLAEAVKAIANLKLEAARDRSYVRMINERRYAPIAETSALEAARRRTDLTIQGVRAS